MSNDVLALWMSKVLTKIGDILAVFVDIDRERVFSWFVFAMLGALVLLPAWRSFQKTKPDSLGKSRRDEPPEIAGRAWQWGLVLGGVNLAFLLTNTLDVVWLWVRRTVPSGVNSTEYLHNGVYGLIFVTILAGAVLAFLFNGAPKLTRSPWLRRLGLLWVAQNLFLVAGVGFRLWLHVESFCLTPRRIGVAFFLALVLAGFVLLVVYILRQKTLRWLFTSNLLVLLALFFGLQFANIDAWCADSAIRSRKASPNIRMNASFISKIGDEGWRVVYFLDTADEPSFRVPVSPKTKAAAKDAPKNAPETELADDVILARRAWAHLLATAELEGAKVNAAEKAKWVASAGGAAVDAKAPILWARPPDNRAGAGQKNPTWHTYIVRRGCGNTALAAALNLEDGEHTHKTLEWWRGSSRRFYRYRGNSVRGSARD
jgi:hypothetical protein